MRLRALERAIKLFLPPIITEPWRRRRRALVDKPYDGIPDREFYEGVFSPWLGYGAFGPLLEKVRSRSLVSADRVWVLYSLASQALALEGRFYEAGVFRGGTAWLLAELLRRKNGSHRLRLFDTFAGMPVTDPGRDLHKEGDFSATSLESVREFVGSDRFISYHPGLIPLTFDDCQDDSIAFAHIDLDIYQSILDACEFIYPRMVKGAVLVFDDYGFMSCPGARQAVDEFFDMKPEVPLVLPTGQAIVFKI